MKRLFQSMLVGLVALQGLACAGGAGVDVEDTAQGAADAAEDIELSALDVAPENVAGEEPDAPEPVPLLSPAERDDQLGALSGSAWGEPDAPDVAPLDNVVLRSNLERSKLAPSKLALSKLALSNAASQSSNLE